MKNRGLAKIVSDFIRQKEASGALPVGAGLAVAALRNGDVLFSEGFGLRERDRGLPVTPETEFEICSVTKTFAATAALLASEEGKLNLERPINAAQRLLPLKDSEITEKISVSDILSHRTGLPSNDLLWYSGELSSNGESLLSRLEHLDFVPGAFRRSFNYNSLMYGALGRLFTPLVGESIETYISRKILAPLEMNSTSFSASRSDNVALPYIGTQRIPRIETSSVAASGAMRSTLEDMTRWLAFHLTGGKTLKGQQLLSPKSLEQMQSEKIAIENPNPMLFQGLEWLGSKMGYGLGWFIGSYRDLKVLYHPGFVDGFSTAVVMIPEKQAGCVVMSNVHLSSAPGLLAQELVNSLLEGSALQETSQKAAEPAPYQLSALGTYTNAAFGAFSVTSNEGSFFIEYNGKKWPLEWKSANESHFTLSAFGLQIPLPIHFEEKDGAVISATAPFSMDPRVAPQIFKRSTEA